MLGSFNVGTNKPFSKKKKNNDSDIDFEQLTRQRKRKRTEDPRRRRDRRQDKPKTHSIRSQALDDDQELGIALERRINSIQTDDPPTTTTTTITIIQSLPDLHVDISRTTRMTEEREFEPAEKCIVEACRLTDSVRGEGGFEEGIKGR